METRKAKALEWWQLHKCKLFHVKDTNMIGSKKKALINQWNKTPFLAQLWIWTDEECARLQETKKMEMDIVETALGEKQKKQVSMLVGWNSEWNHPKRLSAGPERGNAKPKTVKCCSHTHR